MVLLLQEVALVKWGYRLEELGHLSPKEVAARAVIVDEIEKIRTENAKR